MNRSAPVSSRRVNRSNVFAFENADHALQPLLEYLLLVYVLAVLGYAVAPQGFELAALDRAALGEVLDQRVQHRMVVQPARRLAVDQVEQYLQPLVRLLERRFERAYALKQVLFERGFEQGFDASISREGRRAGNNH